MQSRRDHLQAYRDAVERLERAALAGHIGQAGVRSAPMQRSGLGVSIGVVVCVLLCGGAAVFGLVSPAPSTAWRDPGAIIVDQATGTRYLLIDGELHSTANYASALLVAGQGASVQSVKGAQLTGIPVGDEIGIQGAPDDVPSGTSLLPGAWAVCAKSSGGAVLDLDPSGHTGPAPNDERVFVSSADPSNTSAPVGYVVWNSVKYPVNSLSVQSALGLGNDEPHSVDPAWLAALPSGPAVAAPAVPHLGAAGPSVGGHPTPVGTLFSTSLSGAEEDYILRSDGLAPISRTEAALFETDNLAAPQQIDPAAIAAAPVSTDRGLLTAVPDFLSGPVFSAAGSSLCVRQAAPGSTASSELVTEQATTVADDGPVVLPTGDGMLVEPPGQSALAADPVVYLVTDNGRRDLIDSSSALDALQYATAARVVMPAFVLGLIPAGPDLDVDAAARAVR